MSERAFRSDTNYPVDGKKRNVLEIIEDKGQGIRYTVQGGLQKKLRIIFIP